jgi:pyrimidine deaminase RibD-like protein
VFNQEICVGKSDRELMEDAIALLEQCRPTEARRPKVGAVIAVDGVVIGTGHRGTGSTGDDDHAEKKALESVPDAKQLPQATLYTTLEPCTPEVRRDPANCCTVLIKNAGLKRVLIGILDPNQGVRGKGLWELQSSGVDVELFPPDLAKAIRSLNQPFIKEQLSLGIKITNVKDGRTVTTDENHEFLLEGTFLNPPGSDVIAFANIAGRWWPQPNQLRVTNEFPDRTWSVKVHFGSEVPHTLVIAHLSQLGMTLVKYYQNLSAANLKRKNEIGKYIRRNQVKEADALRRALGNVYLGIEMTTLPHGIQVLDQVNVDVKFPRQS